MPRLKPGQIVKYKYRAANLLAISRPSLHTAGKRYNVWLDAETADLVHDYILQKISLCDGKPHDITYASSVRLLLRLGLAVEHLRSISGHSKAYDDILKEIAKD